MVTIKWAPISIGAGFGMSEHLTMRPAVLLFGIDPNSGKIRLLQVNERSRARELQGEPSGYSASFSASRNFNDGCPTIRITVRPDDGPFRMEIHCLNAVHHMLTLRRIQ